ncbi:hypothetical protein HID58_065605 [Brassica napus]|uniref:Uncharacterized protein n=1 Tax=Brassica napus TaxID=3708 RepID=A0ABQ7ZDS1_BRANA|nr:hypothetical protein HID58_065605 [Brassica napus]
MANSKILLFDLRLGRCSSTAEVVTVLGQECQAKSGTKKDEELRRGVREWQSGRVSDREKRSTRRRTVSVKRISRSVLMSWTDGYTS